VELPNQPGGAQAVMRARGGLLHHRQGARGNPASPAEPIRCFVDAGVPASVVNLVCGVPAEISEYLIPQPVIRKISFTGSTAVGKHLAALAGAHMKRARQWSWAAALRRACSMTPTSIPPANCSPPKNSATLARSASRRRALSDPAKGVRPIRGPVRRLCERVKVGRRAGAGHRDAAVGQYAARGGNGGVHRRRVRHRANVRADGNRIGNRATSSSRRC
jgi:aldehyde dehydrogenase family protein